MKYTKKRYLSLFLAFCLLFSLVASLPVFASEAQEKSAYPCAVGDIYVDGEISTKDGIYLLQYLANMVTIPAEHLFAANTYVADDKADGTPSINSKDAILLLQYLAKMNVQLGAPDAPIPSAPATDEDIAARLQETLDAGIHLGATYDIGITEATRSSYTLQGADGFLCLNEDGLLEVIGIKGRSERLHVFNKAGEEIFNFFYTVENSILCTNIKLSLLNAGLIHSRSDDVPHSMLAEITELDLSGVLINDPASAMGVKYLTNLTSLNLSNNEITDISFIESFEKLTYLNLENNELDRIDYILENRGLKTLDVSGNHISDIRDLRHMNTIQYLDLSDNAITDISPLSTMYDLESLHISDNDLTVFRDSLSGLEGLRELGVGNCNISFNDIISLRYLDNLTYLDISGTDPSLHTVATLTNLRTLIMDNCHLASKDVTQLNALINLESLSIADNKITKEAYGTGLSPEALVHLHTLSIGGNAFTDVPDFSGFPTLKHLDLTYSYNLLTIDALASLPLETLILDHCTTLSVEDNGVGFLNSVNALPELKNLSIVSGFNFVTRESYNALQAKVLAGELTLRFLTDRWVDADTIENYSKAIYFSVDELIQDSTPEADGSYTVSFVNPARQIVLSLLNDPQALSNPYAFNIPSGFFQMDIYGSKFAEHVYNFQININERRETSITLNLFDFKSHVQGASAINAPIGSKLIVNAMCGNCKLIGGNGSTSFAAGSAIKGYDVFLGAATEAGATLSLSGGSGYTGADGITSDEHWDAESKTGKRGGDGAHAIVAHDVTFESAGVTVVGGNGGNGGRGGGGKFSIKVVNHGTDGGRGGDGGNGGSGIYCSGTVSNHYENSISAGRGGNGGDGGAKANAVSQTRGPGNGGKTPEPITTYTP